MHIGISVLTIKKLVHETFYDALSNIWMIGNIHFLPHILIRLFNLSDQCSLNDIMVVAYKLKLSADDSPSFEKH
ncbi:hypothetical protein AZSP09_31530 [Azospira sp. I09]|nr:hypothetical protein AZSP09_31530 [Azospira sp. I09]